MRCIHPLSPATAPDPREDSRGQNGKVSRVQPSEAAVSPCPAPCLPRPALGTPGTPSSGEMSLDHRGVRAARASPEHTQLPDLAARAEDLSAGEQARGNPRLGQEAGPGRGHPSDQSVRFLPSSSPYAEREPVRQGAAPGWRPSKPGRGCGLEAAGGGGVFLF